MSILSSSKLPSSLSRGYDSMVGASGLESIGHASTRFWGNDSPSVSAASSSESRIIRMYFDRTSETSITGMLNWFTKLTMFSCRKRSLSSTGSSGEGTLSPSMGERESRGTRTQLVVRSSYLIGEPLLPLTPSSISSSISKKSLSQSPSVSQFVGSVPSATWSPSISINHHP